MAAAARTLTQLQGLKSSSPHLAFQISIALLWVTLTHTPARGIPANAVPVSFSGHSAEPVQAMMTRFETDFPSCLKLHSWEGAILLIIHVNSHFFMLPFLFIFVTADSKVLCWVVSPGRFLIVCKDSSNTSYSGRFSSPLQAKLLWLFKNKKQKNKNKHCMLWLMFIFLFVPVKRKVVLDRYCRLLTSIFLLCHIHAFGIKVECIWHKWKDNLSLLCKVEWICMCYYYSKISKSYWKIILGRKPYIILSQCNTF